MNLAGIAHIQLTVSDFARSRPFYRALCEHFEMHCQYDSPGTETERATLYYIGGKTGLLIRPANPELAADRCHQYKPGLHHLCFRARSREDIAGFNEFFNNTLAARREVVGAADVPGHQTLSIVFEDPTL